MNAVDLANAGFVTEQEGEAMNAPYSIVHHGVAYVRADALEKAEAENATLRRFAGECLEPWPECLYDIDGQMQNRLHRAGLIEERIADHDGDDYEIGESVFFLTDAGKAALAAKVGK